MFSIPSRSAAVRGLEEAGAGVEPGEEVAAGVLLAGDLAGAGRGAVALGAGDVVIAVVCVPFVAGCSREVSSAFQVSKY